MQDIDASSNTMPPEQERLAALRRYDVMDSPADPQFDDLVELAKLACGTPIALISLVDEHRQWFKAKIGLAACETPREISVCQYAIQTDALTLVPDALQDARFKANPLVVGAPFVRAYAGAPLITPSGARIGTLCVLDVEPRTFSSEQQTALRLLSRQVVALLEARLQLMEAALHHETLEKIKRIALGDAERVSLALDSGTVLGTWVWDLERDRFTADERFARTFGMDAETLRRGSNIAEVVQSIHPEDLARVQSLLAEAIERGGPYRAEYRVMAHDGRWLWIDANGRVEKNASGVSVRFPGVLIDITQRKVAEQAIAESEARLSLMIESAEDHAILAAGRDGLITMWSAGAERIFGYRAQEMIGQPLDAVFTPEDRAIGAPAFEMQAAVERGRTNDERWHMRKNGERFYASGTMAAMRTDAGGVTGFIKIARDMTREHRAQEALVEARNAAEAANIAKTEFLANMSHEIRTPMNAVIGLSNILAMSRPLSPKQKEFVETLQMSADSLLSLINDLLDISKIEARTVELEHIPFSATQMVQEIISMMAVRVREKGLAFTSDGGLMPHRVFLGDPTRLRQIVLNLCSNAIKFTEAGGVHVAIRYEPHEDASKENVRIAVRDSGIGIAADKLETIFQKFVQADTSINRKYGGTGLGLAITKTLAGIMGGTIEVESMPGRGSTFTVCVPLEKADEQQLAAADFSLAAIADTVRERVRPRVLLVEDHAPNVMVARTFLEQFGYAVDVAENGLEAYEKVKANPYVAALMDVQMHGMNGFEATRLIREYEAARALPRLPIIGMTAHALAGDRERCLAVGMDDYLSKPFNPDALRRKLEAAMAVESAPSGTARSG